MPRVPRAYTGHAELETRLLDALSGEGPVVGLSASPVSTPDQRQLVKRVIRHNALEVSLKSELVGRAVGTDATEAESGVERSDRVGDGDLEAVVA